MRPALRRSRAAAVAAMVALATAGCGSAPLSLIQLRQQATRVCARANRRIIAIATPADAAAGDAFLKRGIAALEPELRRIKALHAPNEVADVWTTAVTALSEELAALRSAVRKVGAGADPVLTFRRLQQVLTPLETQANDAWQALEIPACVSQ